MKEYKVWAVVEEIDEENDIYKDVSEPACLGTFETQDEAQQFLDLIDIYPNNS